MITWKEFKEEVEKAGVKEEYTIEYIDFDGYYLTIDINEVNTSFVVF